MEMFNLLSESDYNEFEAKLPQSLRRFGTRMKLNLIKNKTQTAVINILNLHILIMT